MVFIFSELESDEFFQQPLLTNLASTNWSTVLSPITFNSNQQRSFLYAFVGRQCNGSWAILKSINPTFTNFDLNLCTYFTYPNVDVTTVEDSGESIWKREKGM